MPFASTGRNFNDLIGNLSSLKRRAILTGAPFGAREANSFMDPYFASYRDTSVQDQAMGVEQGKLDLQKEQLATQGEQFNQQLATQNEQFGTSLAETKRQAQERLVMDQSAADQARKTGLVQTGVGALGTGLTGYHLIAGGSKAVTPALGGSNIAGGGVGNTMYDAPAAAPSTTGGPTLGGAAGVLAIIAAADAIRQNQGQLDRPYEERGAGAKFASAPVTGGPAAVLDVAGMGSDSNVIGSSANNLAKGEENLVGGPLDKAFQGNIGGSLTDFGNAAVNTPGRAFNVVADPVKQATGTVICTELHRQGLLDGIVWETDHKYRDMVTPETYEGYRIIADPIVRIMQQYPLFTFILAPFALRTAREMAHRVNRDIEGSWLGCLVLGVFQPVCEWLGRRGNVPDAVVGGRMG